MVALVEVVAEAGDELIISEVNDKDGAGDTFWNENFSKYITNN